MKIRPNTDRGIDPYTPTYSPPSPKREEDPAFKAYGGDLQEYLRHYHAAVSQVDAGVGLLVEELNNLGIAENTIVVFSSDHGDMQGSHGLINKCVPYEESVRIPFVAAGPGIARGASCEDPIGTVDFFPTFAGLCGLRTPSGIAGHSMADTLARRVSAEPKPIFAEDQSGWAMVRDGEWKLVAELRAEDQLQLFSLAGDPFEMNNLFGNVEASEVQRRLLAALRIWRSENPLA